LLGARVLEGIRGVLCGPDKADLGEQVRLFAKTSPDDALKNCTISYQFCMEGKLQKHTREQLVCVRFGQRKDISCSSLPASEERLLHHSLTRVGRVTEDGS